RPAGAAPRVGLTADEAQDRRLHRLARDLLAADRREHAAEARELDGGAPARPPVEPTGAGTPSVGAGRTDGAPDPVLALALLREAVAEGREVWLEMIGPDGTPSRRRVRPLRVDAGRVRALDAEREAELTVAVHRLATVTPV
ncbi:MAG: hypothetical protein JWP95_411, partial [Actinotalea sp.]|nr:hypothetical protein [Actinotalea sp.]